MAVRRDATAVSRSAVPSKPLRRKRTSRSRHPHHSGRRCLGRSAAGTRRHVSERQRRLIVAGIVAATVAALVLSGFIGGFGRGTVADTDGQLPAGIATAGPAAAQAVPTT